MPHRTRHALAALGVAVTLAGCGAATYNEGDTSDTTRPNRCGETGECEGSVPDLDDYMRAACTFWANENAAPGDWAAVDGCVALLVAAPVPDQQAFADRWLR